VEEGGGGGYQEHEDRSHWPCSVLKRSDIDEDHYTVRIHQSPLRGVVDRMEEVNKNNIPRILTNVPRNSIHYFVRPEATDQNLANAFRHPMGMPDHLFPKRWRNLDLRREPLIVVDAE
jgi:hypothetical protein